MKSAVYLTAASVLMVVVAASAAPAAAMEFVLGMVGPLVVGVATMVVVERTYRRDPAALMRLLVKAFGAKVVLYGAYVTAVVALTSLNPVPFVASFCVYFIGLHLTEAFLLRSLFAQPAS